MRKVIGITFASLILAGGLASCSSPYRVKKKAPKHSKVGFLDFKKAHCGCVGK